MDLVAFLLTIWHCDDRHTGDAIPQRRDPERKQSAAPAVPDQAVGDWGKPEDGEPCTYLRTFARVVELMTPRGSCVSTADRDGSAAAQDELADPTPRRRESPRAHRSGRPVYCSFLGLELEIGGGSVEREILETGAPQVKRTTKE
jgi:hypothetical protein